MRNTIITALIAMTALAACDSRELGDMPECELADDMGDDLVEEPSPEPVPPEEPEQPGPQPRPPGAPEPEVCKPDVMARIHRFVALEYYTVVECPLLHEDLGYYRHEFEFVTDAAIACGVSQDVLDENEDRAINTLDFICSNRTLDPNPSGN